MVVSVIIGLHVMATSEEFLRFAAIIVATGGIVYGMNLIWRLFLKPTYRVFMSLCEFMEAQPTLIDIAHEFKPNDGATLRDQVDLINTDLGDLRIEVSEQSAQTNIKLQNIEGQMEVIIQHMRGTSDDIDIVDIVEIEVGQGVVRGQ